MSSINLDRLNIAAILSNENTTSVGLAAILPSHQRAAPRVGHIEKQKHRHIHADNSERHLWATKFAREFQKEKTLSAIELSEEDFYTNFAGIYDTFKALPKDNPFNKRLAIRILAYLYKFAPSANISQKSVHPLQGKNTEKEDASVYHREDETRLKEEATKAIAKTLGIPSKNLALVTSSRVAELVKNDYYVPHGDCNVFQWKDGGRELDLPPNDYGSFFRAYPNILEAVLQLTSGDRRHLYFDISENLQRFSQSESFGTAIQSLQTTIRDVLQFGIHETLKLESRQMTSTEKQKYIEKNMTSFMKKVDEKIFFGGCFKIGEKYPVMYTGRMRNPDSIPEKDAEATEVDRQRLSLIELGEAWGRTVPQHIIGEISSRDEMLRDFTKIFGGFTPSPLLIMEIWLQTTGGDIDPVLKALGMKKANALGLQYLRDIEPVPFAKSLEELMLTDRARSFGMLSKSSSAPPYQKILPKATLKMIDGLRKFQIEETFYNAGLGKVFSFSVNRMSAAMQSAFDAKDDFVKFINHVQLIHEEVATILAIAGTYRQSDFNAQMQEVTPWIPDDFPVKPKFHFENSGMSCLESVIASTEWHKERVTGMPAKLSIALHKHAYYENSYFTQKGSIHKTEAVNFSEAPEKWPDPKNKYDLFVGFFHTSCADASENYQPADVSTQIDHLYAKNQVADKFTVTIDNTIETTSGKKVTEFLKHNQERIESGKMKVVIMRSALKFDMCGMDNYAAGIRADISVWNEDERVIERPAYSELDYQGTMHLKNTIQDELNERRETIMLAARRFVDPQDPIGFPEQMYVSNANANMIQIVPSSDPNLPFFHIRLNTLYNSGMGAHLVKHLDRHASRNPGIFPLIQRGSFGFNQTTCTRINNGVRVSPGLESDDHFRGYRDYIVLLNDVLLEGTAKYPRNKEAILTNVLEHGDDLIDLISKCKQDDAFASRPRTKTDLEKSWIYVLSGGRI